MPAGARSYLQAAFVGIRMIRSGPSPDESEDPDDPSRGRTLIMLAIATSLDAMAVGLSLAMLKVRILEPAIVIGIRGDLSLLGLPFGHRLGGKFGKRTG